MSRSFPPNSPFPFPPWSAAEVGVLGVVESTLHNLAAAPLQGDEGAPPATLRFCDWAADALDGLTPGQEILVLTWLHLADRRMLRVHPRGDERNPERGVFATRSPHRPNPIGLHRTTVLATTRLCLRVSNLEAVDGTPIIDVKVALDPAGR